MDMYCGVCYVALCHVVFTSHIQNGWAVQQGNTGSVYIQTLITCAVVNLL